MIFKTGVVLLRFCYYLKNIKISEVLEHGRDLEVENNSFYPMPKSL